MGFLFSYWLNCIYIWSGHQHNNIIYNVLYVKIVSICRVESFLVRFWFWLYMEKKHFYILLVLHETNQPQEREFFHFIFFCRWNVGIIIRGIYYIIYICVMCGVVVITLWMEWIFGQTKRWTKKKNYIRIWYTSSI